MSEVRIINVRDICKSVPERWAKQYGNYHQGGDDKREITKNLNALAPEQRDGATIEAIIGNTSWTRQCCDLCGNEQDVLCRMGSEPDYDARWLDVCLACLKDALETLVIALPEPPK